jgi:DNA-binding Lrp family transcriptional regulator
MQIKTFEPVTYRLSSLDERLIAELRSDPRASNKSLAKRLEVNEMTVASRLRRLDADGYLRVVALQDFRLHGIAMLAFVDIRIESELLDKVGETLAGMPQVISVVRTTGYPTLTISIAARSQAEFSSIFLDEISMIPGVEKSSTTIILELIKYKMSSAYLSTDRSDLSGSDLREDPSSPLDNVDQKMLLLLQENGRVSNREMARAIGISEGTIRLRIKRLISTGLLRFVAMVDSTLAGEVAAAFVRLKVEPHAIRDIARQVADLSCCDYVGIGVGDHDVVMYLRSSSRDLINEAISEQISCINGVLFVDVKEPSSVIKHEFHLAYLNDNIV